MKSTSQLQEINHYQDQDFPVNVYYSDIHSMQPPGRWLRDFHWHDELQFTLVLSGTLTMQVDNLSLPGQAGDLIFVNTSLIHAVTQMSEDGSYASLNFPYRLLAFFPGSRMDQDYVLPYTAGGKFSAFSIHPESEWQKELIGLHKKITDLFLSNQVKGNEYSICIKITSMWNLLISNFHSSGNSTSINLLRQQRLQSILLFIYAHYADDLQLSDLAASANISVGECCRIFQNILHTTPRPVFPSFTAICPSHRLPDWSDTTRSAITSPHSNGSLAAHQHSTGNNTYQNQISQAVNGKPAGFSSSGKPTGC